MKYSQYKFTFYLNARHSIYINGVLGESHPHTWAIIINAIKMQKGFILFNDIEKAISKFFDKYQNKSLNDYEPFNFLNPTLENITEYFLQEIKKILHKMGWAVFSIEIMETPARSYIISLVDNNISKEVQLNNLSDNFINDAFSK